MLALFLLALSVALAPLATDASEPAIIRIDAVASDARGRLVEDLRAEDFEIREDGTLRAIDSVRFVRTGAAIPPVDGLPPIVTRADEQAAAGEDGARLFAIFLDEYHVAAAHADRVREAMSRFVSEALGPRDLVLVVKPLESLLNLRLTRDRHAVLRTIETFEGRKGEYDARNAFERELIAGTPQRIEAVRAQIATSALNAVATHLAGLGTARKSIVFVSEGFARPARRRGDEALPSLDTVVRTASRANVSIYPLDPADRSGERAAERDMLGALAAETDGRPIVDNPDAAGMLARIVRERSAYYLIAFRSSDVPADGRFHAVDVRVRRPSVQIEARKGFWAPSPDDLLRARLLANAAAPKPPPEPTRHISPLIRPWFGLARGAGGATQVSFVWEPAEGVPGDRRKIPVAARLMLKASRPDGTTVFDGAVGPANTAPAGLIGVDPLKAVFDAPPGRLRLQMRIEDAASQLVDTDVRDLVVGPLTAPVALGTAEILRARNAREYRALAGATGAVPTSAREFSRGERLLIRVPAYAPDPPVVTATLASRTGAVMRTLPVTDGPAPSLYQIDLPLAGLASGSYIVRFAAKSAAGEAGDEFAFRVTP